MNECASECVFARFHEFMNEIERVIEFIIIKIMNYYQFYQTKNVEILFCINSIF